MFNSKAYYSKNKISIKQKAKAWRKANPKKTAEYARRDKEKRKQYNKQYRGEHKQYYRLHLSSRREETRKWLFMYKSSHPCILCHEADPVVLDFHHRNPQEKEFSISYMKHTVNKQKLLIEIQKCDVLCSNCHRKLHYYNREKQ